MFIDSDDYLDRSACEKLYSKAENEQLDLVLCNFHKMLEKLDNRQFIKAVKTNQIVEALKEKNIDKLAQNLYNDFEEVSKEFEETEFAKKVLMQNNALNTLLAGSGACVFGIFKNKEDAKKAYKNLQNDYETYITTSYNKKEK